MAAPGAPPAKGKARDGGATNSLRRAFVSAALATCIPFLLLIAYLVWGQVSREHSRVERDAFAQASLVSAQVEKHFGARIEALTGAASLLGTGVNGYLVSQCCQLSTGLAYAYKICPTKTLSTVCGTVTHSSACRPCLNDALGSPSQAACGTWESGGTIGYEYAIQSGYNGACPSGQNLECTTGWCDLSGGYPYTCH